MQEIKEQAALEKIIQDKTGPVFFFKHSTRCPISSMALEQFELFSKANSSKASYYIIDLISYRDVSNLLADVSHVTHQSPQVILFQDKKAYWSASHHEIMEPSLEDALESLLKGELDPQ